MKNSKAMDIFWRVAIREAVTARSQFIEPEHFLEALTKGTSCLREGALNEEREHGMEVDDLAADMQFVPELLDGAGINPTQLRRDMRSLLGNGTYEHSPGSVVHRSERARALWKYAGQLAAEMGLDHVHPGILFVAILTEKDSKTIQLLAGIGHDGEKIKTMALARLRHQGGEPKPNVGGSPVGNAGNGAEPPRSILDLYGRDLTQAARDGILSPVIGRRKEILQVIQTLARSIKNNPVLVGDPGVGKTAIVEAIAKRIVDGKDSSVLRGKRIVEISIGALVAGTKYRGEFEDRVKSLLAEAKSDADLILFIDEIHSIVGAGDHEGGLDAANLMKPALARGDVHCIGATTVEEYRKHIEKDAALARRFNKVMVPEPTRSESVEILKGLRPIFEKHHGIRITDESIEASVDLSIRFDNERHLPDKAIDLLDLAAAKVCIPALSVPCKGEEQKQRADSEVNLSAIISVLSEKTGIPENVIVGGLKPGYGKDFERLRDRLMKRVIGQDTAVDRVVKRILLAHSGLRERRGPLAVFLFLGPSGVGKTELAQVLAEELLGSQQSLIRFDMSEFMEQHSVSRLIGSPPGYIGHDEEGQLTGKLRSTPYSIVLLDEIEKAHPRVLDLFLQVFDEGRMTDGHGRTVDAKNAIFIMTSNIGNAMSGRQQPLGFNAAVSEQPDQSVNIDAEVKKHFRIELINRIDDIVRFSPLSNDAMVQIAQRLLIVLSDSLEKQHGLQIEVPEEVVLKLCQDSHSAEFGARNLKRIIQEHVEIPIAQMIAQGLAAGKSTLYCRVDTERIHIAAG